MALGRIKWHWGRIKWHWDRIKWHWDRVFTEYFGFPPS